MAAARPRHAADPARRPHAERRHGPPVLRRPGGPGPRARAATGRRRFSPTPARDRSRDFEAGRSSDRDCGRPETIHQRAPRTSGEGVRIRLWPRRTTPRCLPRAGPTGRTSFRTSGCLWLSSLPRFGRERPCHGRAGDHPCGGDSGHRSCVRQSTDWTPLPDMSLSTGSPPAGSRFIITQRAGRRWPVTRSTGPLRKSAWQRRRRCRGVRRRGEGARLGSAGWWGRSSPLAMRDRRRPAARSSRSCGPLRAR
jgi:hypothetical protein